MTSKEELRAVLHSQRDEILRLREVIDKLRDAAPKPTPEELAAKVYAEARARTTDPAQPACEDDADSGADTGVDTTTGEVTGYPPVKLTATRTVSVRFSPLHRTQQLGWVRFCQAVTTLASQVPPVPGATVHIGGGQITVSWPDEEQSEEHSG